MPQISVIVPVYKVEQYLKRCIDSILSQTFSDFELILVDDGSPDKCPSMCDEYATMDSRILVIHQENAGLSAARNAGIDWIFKNSRSEWITFIDSDDWVHPRYLELFNDALQNNDSMVIMCHYKKVNNTIFDESPIDPITFKYTPEEIFINKREISTIACCKLFHKDLFINHRFPIGKLHEDVFLTYKLLFQCDTIAVIESQPLYYYFYNEDSITNKKWSPKRLDEVEGHEEQLEFFKNSPYKEAYCREVVSYLWVLSEQLRSIRKEKHKYFFVRIKIKFKLTLAFIRFRTQVSLKSKIWAFEAAYPLLSKIYFKISNTW